MRLMSFSMTTPQFLDGTKTVTRRMGWKTLKPGTRLMGVKKAQGIPKGGHVEKLGEIEVVSVRREPLNLCDNDDAAREGFGALGEQAAEHFVSGFCNAMGCEPTHVVTRIVFRRVMNVHGRPKIDGGSS